jgi:hypothetical protein
MNIKLLLGFLVTVLILACNSGTKTNEDRTEDNYSIKALGYIMPENGDRDTVIALRCYSQFPVGTRIICHRGNREVSAVPGRVIQLTDTITLTSDSFRVSALPSMAHGYLNFFVCKQLQSSDVLEKLNARPKQDINTKETLMIDTAACELYYIRSYEIWPEQMRSESSNDSMRLYIPLQM